MVHPRDEQLSGTIDIAPTILDLVGVQKPKEMAGRSLLASSSGGAVIAELGSLLGSLEIRETPVNSTAPDPAVVQQLKALGYLE
jgi:hypothetical protein